MKRGYLSEHFEGIAAKQLVAVEAYPDRSNQHEFNGVAGLRRIFGEARHTFDTRFVYLSEGEEDTVATSGYVTWYDAREFHPTRSEHRLYFPTTVVSEKAKEGDLLVRARAPFSVEIEHRLG